MKLPEAALALFVATAASGYGASAFSANFAIRSRHSAFVDTTYTSRNHKAPARPPHSSSTSSSRSRFGFGGHVIPQQSSSNNGPLRATIEEDLKIVSGADFGEELSLHKTPDFAAPSRNDARKQAASYIERYEGESAAAVIYSKLQEYGTTVVNGYSGGAVLPLLDQFHTDHPRHEDGTPRIKIRWITNSNESSAGHIAEGFAKSAKVDDRDGKMQAGVVVATSGPGVTNLITPLTDAICDGVPMVVLCGQAATFAPEAAFQSCPAVDICKPVTKWAYQIKNAAEVPFVMDYAFYVARNGRPGPVFIDLPKDLQNQVVSRELIDEFTAGLADVQEGEQSFVSLSTHIGQNGEGFYGIHLGDHDEGLSFGVSNDLKLEAITNPRHGGSDYFSLDTVPSNTIHEARVEPDGSATRRVGKLASGEVMNEMVDLIKQARKPIILAGQGCNDAPDELRKFAEALNIPVTTTLHAMGVFDERHPLALNMLGMHGHATPNFMVQECDLLINIGSRFDDRITGAIGAFLPEARRAATEARGGVIHVDIRKSEHAKQVEPNFFVHSTGLDFLKAVNRELGLDGASAVIPSTTTKSWLAYKKQLEGEYPVPIPTYPPQKVTVQDAEGREMEVIRTKMSSQHVIKEMDRIILEAGRMDDCIFSTGVGIHQMVAAQLITWTKPRQMLSSGSLGTMGVCLGYTIGSKLANPTKICIGIDGDGSFNMTFTELKTVAEQKIPIKMLILDNEGQMMVEYWQRLFHAERYIAVRNKNPDYTALADAFGIKNIYCDHAEDLDEKMREFLFSDPDEPVIFHVRVERTPCMPMVAPGKALDDMIHRDEAFDVDASAAPS